MVLVMDMINAIVLVGIGGMLGLGIVLSIVGWCCMRLGIVVWG